MEVSAQLSKLRKEEAEKVKQGKKPFYHSKQHAQQKMLEEQSASSLILPLRESEDKRFSFTVDLGI